MTFIHWFNQRQANERFMLLGAAIILIVLIISTGPSSRVQQSAAK